MKKILLIALCLFSVSAFAQKTPTEWAELPDDKFHKKMRSGTGFGFIVKIAASEEELPELERVGILSFTLYSPTYGQYQGSGAIFSPYLTEAGSLFYTDALYDPALPEMRKQFEAHGITLLTPDQYLDTPEKQKLFDETEFEHSNMWKAVGAISSKIRASIVGDIKAQPEGMKYIYALNADAKVWREVGKFAGELDLDAVLVIESTIGFDGKQGTLQRIDATIVGPNTVPDRPENKNYYAPFGPVKGYLEGASMVLMEVRGPKAACSWPSTRRGS